MIKAYNDWHVDEWCGAYPERFIPCGILPLFDVHEAAAEVAPARGQGLPRGHVLREPRRPRHAEHPFRRVGSAVRRVLRRRHGAVLPRRLVVEVGVDRARRARAGADEPLVGDGDLHARRPVVGRLLAPLPDAALRAHRGRHRLDPLLPAAGRAHARPAQRLDAATMRRRGSRRASCSASASCAASSRTGSACSCSTTSTSTTCAGSPTTRTPTARGPTRPSISRSLFAGLDRRRRRQDHAPQRDAPLPVRPVRDPAARAVHGRRAAAPRRRRRHRHPRRAGPPIDAISRPGASSPRDSTYGTSTALPTTLRFCWSASARAASSNG